MFQWLKTERETQAGQDALIYLDETGFQSTQVYPSGWSPQGQPCHGQRLGGYGERWNLIAALRAGTQSLIEPFYYQGSTYRAWFEVWLERLCQTLQGKTHYLILDNAAFHHGGRIQAIAQSYGQVLMYLPPYSPELNPIEHRWATLKQKVLLLREHGLSLLAAIEQVICSA